MGQNRLILGGQVLFVGMLMLFCFMLYLDLFRKDYYQRKGSLSLLFTLIVFYSVITAFMVTHNIFNVYIIPYAMLPIIIRVFLDSRTAFLTHVITILICSISLRFPHEFILDAVGSGISGDIQPKGTIAEIPAFPNGLISDTDLCSHLFCFRTDDGEWSFHRLLKVEHTNVHLLHHQWNSVIIHLSFTLFIEKKLSDLLPMLLWWNFRISITIFCGRCLKRFPEPSNIPCKWPILLQKQPSALEPKKPVSTYRSFCIMIFGKMENPAFFHRKSVREGVNPHKNLNYEQKCTGRYQPCDGWIETGG